MDGDHHPACKREHGRTLGARVASSRLNSAKKQKSRVRQAALPLSAAAGEKVERRSRRGMESSMLRKSWFVAASVLLLAGSALAGTFGKVVSIGGHASDVALDEPRGVLYIANFTANRIEIMSLQSNTVQTSLSVAAQPSAISVSPDGHWLLVAHYGNNAAPSSPTNGLTLVDLRNNYAKQVFVLPDPPLGLAFGADNRALVLTTKNFLLFDPAGPFLS